MGKKKRSKRFHYDDATSYSFGPVSFSAYGSARKRRLEMLEQTYNNLLMKIQVFTEFEDKIEDAIVIWEARKAEIDKIRLAKQEYNADPDAHKAEDRYMDRYNKSKNKEKPTPLNIYEDNAYFRAIDELVSAHYSGWTPQMLIDFTYKNLQATETYIKTFKEHPTPVFIKQHINDNMSFIEDMNGYDDDYTNKEKEYITQKLTALFQLDRMKRGGIDRTR